MQQKALRRRDEELKDKSRGSGQRGQNLFCDHTGTEVDPEREVGKSGKQTRGSLSPGKHNRNEGQRTRERCRKGDVTIRRRESAGRVPKSAADELMTRSCAAAAPAGTSVPSGGTGRSGSVTSWHTSSPFTHSSRSIAASLAPGCSEQQH